ncbi:hypothetical protein [Xenophilus sp. Marseille-Q4582]|uniref:beta strand repeat-containing protein n=1 Tax=Xenophilus sp. Marseille-Q4582 TaxID=2866600 RepID=UPI001CE44B7A|nr:hypothetical protein [Xenophilus sp. Marseille-Q4582]
MAVIDNYGPNEQAIIELFSAVFNKAPTPDLIAGGAAALADGATPGQILDLLFNYPDVPFTGYKSSAPTNAFVTTLVNNLTAGSSISAEVKAAWVALLAPEVAAFDSYGDFAATVVALVSGGDWEEGSDLAALQANLAAKAETSAEASYDSTDTYGGWNSLPSALGGGGGETPTGLELTVGQDNIVGTSGNDTITASLAQNSLGAVSNTWDSGDKIDGGEGYDVFNATLTSVVTGGVPVGPAIDANIKNVEEVHIRAQFANLDLLGNGFNTIDAENASGVQQWWSDNSRSTVIIEDIRTRPEHTTFGMRQTDPIGHDGFFTFRDGTAAGPSLVALFDPAQLTNTINNSNSSLTLLLTNNADPASELAAFSLEAVGFTLGGVEFVLDGLGSPATYAALVTALEAAIAAEPELAGVTVTLNADNSITLTDVDQGREFVGLGYGWDGGLQPPSGQLEWDLVVGQPVQEEVPIKTNIILDDVGRSAQGGSALIGSFAETGGIEQFDVKVDRSSWVTSLTSTNNALETVNISHLNAGATSYLYIGDSTRDNQSPNGNPGSADYATTTDDRLTAYTGGGLIPINPNAGSFGAGLVDVRTFNAAGFEGELKVGAALTAASIDKYLIGATEPVQFTYTLGDAGSNLSLFVDNALAADPDFALDIIGGLGDDRVNLTGAATKRAISIDGGEGFNTLEVDTSVGTTAANSFESVTNIQKLVVAGNGGATIDFDTGKLDGVEEVWVATESNGSTTLRDLQASVDTVYISGKNQTLGANASNNNQYQGTVTITNAAAAALTVVLDNTARLDGLLDVDSLVIDGTPASGNSAVRELTILSDGARDVVNEIDVVDALRVNTFNLEGTQDLTAYIHSASNWTAPLPADRDSLTVDGSELTGDLHLLVNTSVATTIDGTVDRTNTFTGTAGADDVLQFTNFNDPSLLFTTTNTKITGFETLVFGDNNGYNDAIDGSYSGGEYTGGVNGSFNNGATTGVESYFVDHFHGGATAYRVGTAGVTDDDFGLELINLGDNVNVGVFTADSYSDGADTALTLRSSGVLSAVNVDLTHTSFTGSTTYDLGDWAGGGLALEVGGYRTINLDLDSGRNGTASLNYDFDLVLLDRNGLQSNESNFVLTGDAAANWATQGVAARELILTGGNAAARNGDAYASDSVQLADLDAALEVIDLSGYAGQVTGNIDAAYTGAGVVGDPAVTDVKVVLGGFDVNWTVNTSTGVGEGYNTTFEFTTTGAGIAAGAGTSQVTWTINNFIGADDTGVNANPYGTINSHTILDVSGLGITAYNQLRVTYDGADTFIRSEAETLAGNGYSWEIKLAGADYSEAGDLGISENFIFA